MQINVTVEGVENIGLATAIETSQVYDHDEEGYVVKDVTLGEVIAKQVTARLTKDDQYPGLRKRFLDLRDEEIREQVKPIVAEVIARPIQKTNGYGEPTGQTTTLTELIVAEAQTLLTKPVDQYNRDSGSFIQQLVRKEISAAFAKELNAILAEEKAKVVAAVRAKGAELLAEAVKQGLGR